MRLTPISLAAGLLLASGTFAQAAGHETMVAPDAATETTMTAPKASVDGTYVVLGIFAALLIVAASTDNEPVRPLPR